MSPRTTLAQCAAALYEHKGDITDAAESLKITRQALHMRVARNKSLQAVKDDIKERLLDRAEKVNRELLDKMDGPTARWTLAQLGKARGYGKSVIDEDQLEKIVAAISNDPAALRRMADGE